MRKTEKREEGQVLLAILLVTTITFIVGVSVLRTSTEDTRLAKLEEDAKKAYAAAEAGIEAVLETNSDDLSGLSFSGIENIEADIEDQPTGTFITPLIPKDGQYTFYFAPYNEATKEIGGDAYSGAVTISLSDPSSITCAQEEEQLAVEVSFLDFDTGAVYRRLIDPCDLFEGEYHEWSFGTEYTLSSSTLDPIAAHVMILRVIAPESDFEGVKLAIDDNSGTSQGKVIISTATTNTGVAKKIKLFKSYPQLPADFFVTSF